MLAFLLTLVPFTVAAPFIEGGYRNTSMATTQLPECSSQTTKVVCVSGTPYCQLQPDTGEKDTQTEEETLDRFVRRLKSFMLETLFDVHGFEYQGEELQRELSEIENTVQKHLPCHRALSKQLTYAKHMFDVMVDSIELLKYYESIEKAGRHFVCAVIDLNVRLLALRDSRGGPDFSLDSLAIQVYSYTQYLGFLKEGFEAVEFRTFGKSQMFKKQHSRAEKNLTDLASYLPPKNA